MPWTLFVIPAVVVKDLRKNIKEILDNEILIFCLIMVCVNFPVYWLLPNARVRYFLPSAPFAAILTAGLFEFYLKKSTDNPHVLSILRRFMKFLLWIVLFAALALIPLIIFMRLEFSLFIVLLMLSLIFLAISLIRKNIITELKNISAYITLFAGLCWMMFANLNMQYNLKIDNYSPKIASEIQKFIPEDVKTIYELEMHRLLNITCYLNKEVIDLDNVAQLKNIAGEHTVYFIFDTKFVNNLSKEDSRIFLQDLRWNELYSKSINKEKRNSIILGCVSKSDKLTGGSAVKK